MYGKQKVEKRYRKKKINNEQTKIQPFNNDRVYSHSCLLQLKRNIDGKISIEQMLFDPMNLHKKE